MRRSWKLTVLLRVMETTVGHPGRSWDRSPLPDTPDGLKKAPTGIFCATELKGIEATFIWTSPNTFSPGWLPGSERFCGKTQMTGLLDNVSSKGQSSLTRLAGLPLDPIELAASATPPLRDIEIIYDKRNQSQTEVGSPRGSPGFQWARNRANDNTWRWHLPIPLPGRSAKQVRTPYHRGICNGIGAGVGGYQPRQ